MRTLLNKLETKSKLFFLFGKFVRRIYISIQNKIIEKKAKKRQKGWRDPNYLEILSLKNTHIDDRCFILATGPSLTLDDVLLLKNEFTFGMNSICLLYEQTEWRPDFFGIQDESVFERVKNVLLKNPKGVFVSSNIKNKYPDAKIFPSFQLNSKYNYFDYRYTDRLNVKFSDNAYAEVYDAYSITFSLIQIAVFMGFKNIYLLGCDCNQAIGIQNHFIETGHLESDDKLASSAARNIYSHAKIKEFCEKRGVVIYNATRGGKLEVYERVKLEDVLKL